MTSTGTAYPNGEKRAKPECTDDKTANTLFLADHLKHVSLHDLRACRFERGRSESWVEVRAIDDDEALPDGFAAYPHSDGLRAERGWEQISVIAPEPAASYAGWRAARIEKELAGLSLGEGRRAQAARAKLEATYPSDLLDCLQRDTSWWKAQRWGQPPGSRRVIYWRRAIESGPRFLRTPAKPAPVTTMLLALTPPSQSRTTLPPCARTLPQAELIHRALVSRVARGERVECPELTGKAADGSPLEGHQHTHILPLDLDDDGHLDHVVLHAPMGLWADAQRAVESLRRTWSKRLPGDIQIALVGRGGLHILRALPSPLADGVQRLLGPQEGARVWQSATAFVCPRHVKKNGANTVTGQVLSELTSRGLPLAEVELLPWTEQVRPLRHMIRTRRPRARPPPADAALVLRLTFQRAVKGPLSLGYAAHFGLGRFEATS
jgi:CRISPR-associated protein Csb2